jgi:hypothetical protein
MIYALEERIGEPSLFCGRKQQKELLINWVNMIPEKMAKSRALLGRRKCGKTAMMQRLFNILWNKNGQVIPFYFEVLDQDQWLLDFADAYYRTFISQYLSFKTRRVLDAENHPWDFVELVDMAKQIDDKNVLKDMKSFQRYFEAEQVQQAMSWAFGAPAAYAGRENVFFLVMIDEIQFMTKSIFYDKEHKVPARRLPGAYHGLVESKVAPMLVSGSYVGWMIQMMHELFKGGRLKQTPISPKLTVEEGLEAIYQYAQHNNKTVSDEAAVVINLLTQSDPFYIASLFRSDWEEQDFTSVDGAIKTLAYEIRNQKGELFGTWSEYIFSTIKEVNDKQAKKILLFLSKERYKEYTRLEISNHLGGKLDDNALEKKLQALEYGDLITRPGLSRFRYCGIDDDILDLIFRDLYQEEIDDVIPNIVNELTAKVAALEKDKKSLKGMLNELKGKMLELIVYRELNRCRKERKPVSNFQQRLRPALKPQQAVSLEKLLVCSASRFETTWMNHYVQLPGTTAEEIDVLAEGSDADSCWALVFEIKNRAEKNLPSMKEAQLFVAKVSKLKQLMSQTGKAIKFVCPVYLSSEGFDCEVETWLHEQGILTTDMAHWEIGTES